MACQSGEVPMDVACVISSTPDTGGIEKAKRLGIPAENIIVVNPKDFRMDDGAIDRNKFGEQLLVELKRKNAGVVTQNGWLPLTPENVIAEYEGMIFNQHPGPVPEFGGKGMYGRRVHAARLLFARTVKRGFWTEAIAQRVHKEFDQGVVVKSQRVEILPDDTVETLQQRVLPVEHAIQIALLKDIANDSVKEVAKRESFVRPDEEAILVQVKEAAIKLYPRG